MKFTRYILTWLLLWAGYASAEPLIDGLSAENIVGSPDFLGADRVAYSVERGGRIDVMVRDLKLGKSYRYASHPLDDLLPKFSPTGEYLAWIAQRDDVKGDLFLGELPVDNRPTKLSDSSKGVESFAWSTDGSAIVYVTRDPFLNMRQAYRYDVKENRTEDLKLNISKALPGCLTDDWLMVGDERDNALIYASRAGDSLPKVLVTLEGLVNQWVNLGCSDGKQQVYLSTLSDKTNRDQQALGVGLLTVDWRDNSISYENLIGESLPRIDLGHYEGMLIGRTRADSRLFVSQSLEGLTQFRVARVSLGELANLGSRERLHVINAKAQDESLSTELASFYRFLTFREARRATEASSELSLLWQQGCLEAYQLASIYLRRELAEERGPCVDTKQWEARLAFARADQLMFRGEADKANQAFEDWAVMPSEPYLRFIGLTRWTRLMTWIDPLDALLRVLQVAKRLELKLEDYEKTWFFNKILEQFAKLDHQAYSILISQWPEILDKDHVARSLVSMLNARQFAAAKAWPQAFAAASKASEFFESRAGRFTRQRDLTAWMLESGSPRKALAMLQELESTFPHEREDLRSLRNKLRSEMSEVARSAERRGDAKTAYALYSQLLILEPDDLAMVRQMLAQAGAAGFLNQKVEQYAEAVELETAGWVDHYLYGLALTFTGADGLADAERQLKKARNLQPQSVDVVRTLSWVLLNKNPTGAGSLLRAEQVIELVERQLSRMDVDAEGYRELEYALSIALCRLGKFDRAQSILKKFEEDFQEVSIERSAYLSLRADLAYRTNDNEAAISWLLLLIRDEEFQGREERLAELRGRLGVVYYASGDVAKSLSQLEKARLDYAQLKNASKERLIERIVKLLKREPLGEPYQEGREPQAWKWSLAGLERTLYIASSRAAEAEASSSDGVLEATESSPSESTLSAKRSTLSKGVSFAPYGDELHWYRWSRATSDYNRSYQTFDLGEMNQSLQARIDALLMVWKQGVLEFGYVQEVRDVFFDALELLKVKPDSFLITRLETLLSALPTSAKQSDAWRTFGAEVEAYVLRDLSQALTLCPLVSHLRLSDAATLGHLCNVEGLAQRDSLSLEQDIASIDALLERRGTVSQALECSANELLEAWTARGYLPTDLVRLRRLLRSCPEIDAWQRSELVIALESTAFRTAASPSAHREGTEMNAEQLSEALIWALDEDITYLGGLETEEGWWFLELGQGQTKISQVTEAELLDRLKYWLQFSPVVSTSLAKLTLELEPSVWNFSSSFLAYWEQETWDGPSFISVPEHEVKLEECPSAATLPLTYETLVVALTSMQGLSDALFEVEKCLRGRARFHQVSFRISAADSLRAADFARLEQVFRQKSRFPVERAQIVLGELVLNLGPAPARNEVWVRVWNETFQPLFSAALTARKIQQTKPSEESHRRLVSEIERIVELLDGIKATAPDTLNRYLGLSSARGSMFQQIVSRFQVIRSQFLTWSIGSYEALDELESASKLLSELLSTGAWGGDLNKLGLWSRKQASFLTALERSHEALEYLERCWSESVVDCGIELGSRYLSLARYREAERIGDGLVGLSNDSRANVEGIDILARIAEQERYDFDAAVELLLRAYAISGDVDLDLRVRLSINLMRVARLAGDYRAAETLGNSVAAWELTTAQRLRVELTRAQTWYVSGQARKVVRAMASLTNLAEDIGDRFTKMLCTSLWALSALEVGRYNDARALAESALKQAQSLDNRREIANQLNNLGLVYARIGLHEEAAKALNEAMTSDFTGRDTMSLAYSMRNLGQQKVLAGLPKEAGGLLEEAAHLSRKSGDRINEARARFSLLLNRETLDEPSLGEAFWRLSEDAKALRLVEVQWRSLFGAYRYLKDSLNEEQSFQLLKEIFDISMSHIGLASERLGPGRQALRNEYHARLLEAGKAQEAMAVALRFAQPTNQRGLKSVLSMPVLQSRLNEDEALWYGWFDKLGWKGWLITVDGPTFVSTDWNQDESSKVFEDLERRFREYAPLGRSLEMVSAAFSFLMKDRLAGVRKLKILELPNERWIPYRALSLNGKLLDERVQLEWVIPLVNEKFESETQLTYHLTNEFSDDNLTFATLENQWLSRVLGTPPVNADLIFETRGQLHMTGHFNGLGKLEDLWFRRETSDTPQRWPERIFVSTCGPQGHSIRANERYGALLTALSSGTDVALAHRLRVSDWAAAVLAKRYYSVDKSEEPSELARQATRFVRRMFEHPAHWAGFEVISGL